MKEPQAVNFGALPPLPPGYRVVWSETCEMYIPQGPEDWEGRMTWDRFRARREALHHAGPTSFAPKAWGFEVDGVSGVTFAMTRNAAKWNAVEAHRDAGYSRRGNWPKEVRAFRRPEFDGHALGSRVNRSCYDEETFRRTCE